MWAAVVLALLSSPEVASAAPGACSYCSDTQPVGATDIVAAIQVQGNTATPDDEVRRLADVRVGMPLEAATIEDVARRLRATKRFERVEVLKRFASIADPTQIMLVIIVDEGAVKIQMTGDPDHPTRVVRSHRPNILFLPVLRQEDGYGLTYGARLAIPEFAGKHSRLYFPLTWGGTKQATMELDQRIEGRPIDRFWIGGSVSRRKNPAVDEDDDRARVWVRGEREIVHGFRVGSTAGWQHVSFANVRDRFAHVSAEVVVDTRLDPVLARNAVYIRTSWEHLAFGGETPEGLARPVAGARYQGGVNRTDVDARGYLGFIGQSVIALRAMRSDADRPLPLYLQPLLGGQSNLRGFQTGIDTGDTLVATAAEVILPLTSPLKIGKVGVTAFIDRGTVYDKGERFEDQTLRTGYGGSVWFTAAFLRFNLAVAHGRGASTRVHAGGNITF